MSEEYQPTAQLTQLIIAARICRLVWIDDKFARNTSSTARLIRNKIATLWGLSSQATLRHPQLQEIPIGSDADYVETRLQAIIAASDTESNLSDDIIDSLDAQIGEIDASHSTEPRDLSSQQFREIKEAFARAGVAVMSMSYAGWVDQQAGICTDLKASDLFFVDHDFSSEEGGDATTGETILATLLAQEQQSFTCILFTHGTGIHDQKATAAAVADRLGGGAANHRFRVVSKESITSSEANSGYASLSSAFKDAFLSDWVYSIAEKSRHVFDEAFRETTDVLLRLSVEDLAAAFFRKPFSEGTSEVDVLLRIFMLAARVKLEDRRHTESFIWERLAAIRGVLAVPQREPVRAPTNKTLQAWHEREIFDPPEVVNASFTPIFLGDVFEVQGKRKASEYYVLVAQQCDLIIRNTSFRKSSEALFLAVSEEAPKDRTFGYEFEFPNLGQRWVRYGEAFTVNLNLLDLVSFRSDGKMTFSADLQPSELMLPGVRVKFENLKAAFAPLYKKDGQRSSAQLPLKYQQLALSGLSCLSTIVEDKQISFPIARIGRIRSPHAEAILGGLAIHNTRVAFEYNFADLSGYCDPGGERCP